MSGSLVRRVSAHVSGESWLGRRWAHLDLLPTLPDGRGERCRVYCSISGPLQSVQRAAIWEVLVALQGRAVMHIGVGNLNVVNHVGSLIARRCLVGPSLWSMMVIFYVEPRVWFEAEVVVIPFSLKLRVMLMRVWLL